MGLSSYNRFLVLFGLTVLGILAAAMIFNFTVDPYGWRDSARHKHEAFAAARLTKAVRVRDIGPEAVILGSSRAEFGLDPATWAVLQPGLRVYNLGFSGARIAEVRAYFEHALAAGTPRQAVLALDLFMFGGAVRAQPGYDPDMLCRFEGTVSHCPDYTLLRLRLLASRDMTYASLKTLFSSGDALFYRPDGLVDPGPIQAQITAQGGHEQAAFLSDLNYERRLAHYFRFGFTYDDGASAFDPYRDILALAHARGVDLRIVISPSHVRQWEALDRAAGYQWMDEWKRHLVAINEAEAAQAGRQPFPLWDFSDYSPYTTEMFPTSPEGKMDWHWESSHYKKELGDLVLRRVFGRVEAEGFGTVLTGAGLDAHLARLREDRRRWQERSLLLPTGKDSLSLDYDAKSP